ncbi:hypothetical protein [Sphingopyxis sp. R3-92]|uniref:AbiTii domain-containing protein n=1 Tax=Sphingopyxis sp. R3-92 TaxID=3158553 RepID=UPI003EE81DF9
MAGLVEEIQALALDPTVRVADLLRRVKLTAVKLKLQDAVEWVDLELQGYAGIEDKDVPLYRHFTGRLMEQSPHFGIKPAYGDPETLRVFSYVVLKEAVSSLEELAKAKGTLGSPLDADLEKMLHKNSEGYLRSYHISFGHNVPVSILSHVKDMVMDWACALESQGILGEGISFTVEEKKKAAEVAQSVTIHNYGHLHQGDVTGHQNRTVVGSSDQSINSLEINDTFDQLIQVVDSSIGNENDRESILEIVRAMQAAQGTPEYKPLFQRWVGYVAEYAAILGPFVPALSGLIG